MCNARAAGLLLAQSGGEHGKVLVEIPERDIAI
jgi:hypothetical protein